MNGASYIPPREQLSIFNASFFTPCDVEYIGITGSTGMVGPSGVQGITGARGPSGVQGFTGIEGVTGGSSTGPDGTWIVVKATKTGVATSGGNTISGWTEISDTASAFNHTTGVFTAPSAGYYNVCGVLGIDDAGSNALYGLQVNKNNVADADADYNVDVTAQNSLCELPFATIVSCNTNDTIQLKLFNSGGNKNYKNAVYNTLSIAKL